MAKNEAVQNTLRLIQKLAEAVGQKTAFSEEDLYNPSGVVITDIKSVGTDQIEQLHKIAEKLLLNKFMYVNLKSEQYINNNTSKIGTNLYFQFKLNLL
jgi:translation elongation factor EF-Ts